MVEAPPTRTPVIVPVTSQELAFLLLVIKSFADFTFFPESTLTIVIKRITEKKANRVKRS